MGGPSSTSGAASPIAAARDPGGATRSCAVDAVGSGELELDVPLAVHWPELTGDGRETITLRHVLSHRAGLPGWRRDAGLAPEDLLDGARMAAALAREQPFWRPGEAHGYHARSYGFLLAEVLRRATGESVGARLRRRVTGPRDLDFHIGLEALDMERCADLVPAPAGTAVPEASRPMLRAMADADSVTAAAFAVPPQGRGATNSAAWRAAELPAMNGHCTARGLAGLYAAVLGGRVLPAALLEEARSVHSEGEDRVLLQPTTFGLGFMCSRPTLPVGLGDASVGHAGAGGSVGFADPEAGVAFAFVMNRMRPGAVTGNDSALALVEAVRTALA
jgi:CubicO group peptidase (beta-lactamase class C family)